MISKSPDLRPAEACYTKVWDLKVRSACVDKAEILILTNAGIENDMSDAIREHCMIRSDVTRLRTFDKITHY